jgi:hypothetical protein
MHFNETRNHLFPSLLPVDACQRMVGGLQSLLCFLLCVLALPASAQNLLVNGDFEAGTLSPWQGGELFANPSGGLCGRVGEPRIGDTLWQSVATVPGQRYLLSGELRSEDEFPSACTAIARSHAGSVDGARHAIAPVGTFHRFTLPFTATTATTLLELSSGGVGDFVLIDNVSLIPVLPGAGGSYAGTIVTTVAVTDPAMSAKSSRKVTARINEDGEIVLLDGTAGIITGYILTTGEFSLTLPDGTTVTGSAVVRGRRIQLEYVAGSHAAVTFSGAPVVNTVTQSLSLVRRK